MVGKPDVTGHVEDLDVDVRISYTLSHKSDQISSLCLTEHRDVNSECCLLRKSC